MPSRPIRESDIVGGDWEVFEITPSFRKSRLWISDDQYIVRTEYLADEQLIEDNQQAFNDSHGKRWGDGKIVARVPLNVLYGQNSEISKKLREGDQDHLKWWLDREDARPYRRFKGQIS